MARWLPRAAASGYADLAPTVATPRALAIPCAFASCLPRLDGPAYLERVTVDTPAHVRKAKKAIKKAFQNQVDGVGYSRSSRSSRPVRPTGGMTPQESFEWMRVNMLP